MTRRSAAPLCLALLIASCLPARAQGPDLQPTVDEFYPADRLKPATAADRQSCSATLGAAGTSQPAAVLAALHRLARPARCDCCDAPTPARFRWRSTAPTPG